MTAADAAAPERWTYEVELSVQVQLDGPKRDDVDEDVKRAAIADLEAHGAHISDAVIVGWWPAGHFDPPTAAGAA